MNINEAIAIDAVPTVTLEAARTWLRGELANLGGEVSEGTAPDGSPSLTSVLEQDGILMTTSVVVLPHNSGSKVSLNLRTEGISRRDKLRNVSLLPGRKLVQKQARASLLEIRELAMQEHQSPG